MMLIKQLKRLAGCSERELSDLVGDAHSTNLDLKL